MKGNLYDVETIWGVMEVALRKGFSSVQDFSGGHPVSSSSNCAQKTWARAGMAYLDERSL